MHKNTFKVILVALIIVVVLLSLFGCSDTTGTTSDGSKEILCTTFPQYDWVCNIVGESENIKVSLLLDNGEEMHSFQPSADDIIQIKNSSMVIYNGGVSDKAIADILADNSQKDRIVFNMMNNLGDRLLYESYEKIAEHKHEHDDYEHSDSEYDEHIWLSLENAAIICERLVEEIKKLDPDNSAVYEENANVYISKLKELDKKYKETVSNSYRTEIVFVDRYPFRYLAEDYNLTCYAAFPGCTTETDASFNTILFLAEKIDELGINSAVTIEKSNTSIASAVRDATDSKKLVTLTMNSLQSVTKDDIESGITYLSVMDDNLIALQKILN